MLSPADQVERWQRELRAARAEDDRTLRAAARVARAESQLRFWEALQGVGQRKAAT